jgi:hypothetical protein
MTDVPVPFHQAATDLDDEAMKGSDLLENLMREAREKNAQNPQANTEPTRRGPGRPRGSRNVAASARQPSRVSPTRVVSRTPSQGSTQGVDPNTPDPALLKELKEARASELQEKISDAINETIMLGLTSIGVPIALLYKPGQEPAAATESEKYTDMAKGLTITPNQAKFWGRLLAELESTEAGKKFSNTTGTGNGPLLIYGALSIMTGLQYIQNASNTYKQLKPFIDQYHAMQEIMAQQAREAREQAEAQNNAP